MSHTPTTSSMQTLIQRSNNLKCSTHRRSGIDGRNAQALAQCIEEIGELIRAGHPDDAWNAVLSDISERISILHQKLVKTPHCFDVFIARGVEKRLLELSQDAGRLLLSLRISHFQEQFSLVSD